MDPEEECFKATLEVKEVVRGQRLIFTDACKFPDDASQGTWRLDEVEDAHIIYQQLSHVEEFCTKHDLPLHRLVVEDLLYDPETLESVLELPETMTYWAEDVADTARIHGLNGLQTQALFQVCRNRCSLIQGPPGTGKTLTSRAISCEFEKQAGWSVLCAYTNAAVDNMVVKTIRSLKHGLARPVSKKYEEELLCSCNTETEI